MHSSPLSSRGRAFLGLAALALPLFFATALLAEAPRPEQTLTLGQETQEQPIKAGEAHPWRIAVAPGTSVLVTIDQRSIGLVAEVRGTGSKKSMVFGAGNDRWGPVVLLLDTAGDYRVEVRPRDPWVWPGRYTMRAEAVPSAGERHDALILMSRAGREAVPDTPESRTQAAATYRQALMAWHHLGERAWEAEAQTCVAMLEQDSSDLPRATQDFQGARDLWQQLGESRREAEALNRLGFIGLRTQGVDTIREALKSALALWQGSGEKFDAAETGINLCLLEQYRESMEKALTCHQASLQLFRELGDPRNQAKILSNIGGAQEALGQPEAAFASYEQALAVERQLGDRLNQAKTLNNMGKARRRAGEWQEALRIYGEARKVSASAGDRALEATMLNNIAYTYGDLGEPERALPYLKKALTLRQKTGDRSGEVTTLNNLGAILRKLSDWRKALDLHRKALKLAGPPLDDITQQAVSRQGLAEVYLDRGDAEAALRELAEAARLEKVDLRTQTSRLSLRGRALILRGRPREALPILEEVLASRRAVRDHAGEADTLDELAVAKRSLGLTAEARADAETALQRVEELRTSFYSPDLRASFLATRRRAFALLIELLMDQGHDREAFAVSERGRARSLLDALRAAPAASTAPSELLAQRRSLIRRLSDKTDQRWKQSGDKAAAVEQEIDEILSDLDRVEAEIGRQSPRPAAPSPPQPATPEEIAGGLGTGTMLLEYSLGERRSFLWAIDARGLRSFTLPAQKVIDDLALKAYKELSSVEAGKVRGSRPVEDLSRLLLSPVWKDAARLQRLVIVPDASLQILPFAALPVPDSGHGWRAPEIGKPLLEHLEVVYIPSATTLVVQRQRWQGRQPAPKWAMVFADPVFATGGRKRPAATSLLRGGEARGLPLTLAPLPATRREAEEIRELAPPGKVKVELGLAANRKTVLSGELRDYRILHFATHAMADTQNPELSGLMLSQVDSKGHSQEGFLGLADIYELDLNADLVVLSGCQTGLGKEVRGEGLMGLTRGFQYAGVPRVVASLWRVQDRATAELMTHFYQAMWRGHDRLSPAAALRSAQLSLLHDPHYRNPYFWAGFVLQGDWH